LRSDRHDTRQARISHGFSDVAAPLRHLPDGACGCARRVNCRPAPGLSKMVEAMKSDPDMNSPRWIPLPGFVPPRAGMRRFLRVEDRSLLVFCIDDALHAIEDGCPHAGASFFGAPLEGCVVTCPGHGLRFDLATGGMVGGPGLKLRKLAIECSDGQWRVAFDASPD
jgi:3-phenylpropionate/trans-cinnamate dioxygenase ferredoxin component